MSSPEATGSLPPVGEVSVVAAVFESDSRADDRDGASGRWGGDASGVSGGVVAGDMDGVGDGSIEPSFREKKRARALGLRVQRSLFI